MLGLAESLRLPGSPLAALEEESEATDGVLLRLLALRKGRALLARILSLLAPPPQVCDCCCSTYSAIITMNCLYSY